MSSIIRPILPDGRTGFDKFGQLMTWTVPDEESFSQGFFIRDVRDRTCYICGRKWELTSEDFQNQTSVDDRVMHRTCLEGHSKMAAYPVIQNALIEAGYLFKMTEVPPKYPYSTPWQVVTINGNDAQRTDSGWRISLGRRKRVWSLHLHVSDADIIAKLAELFKDCTDTKGYDETPDKDQPELGPYFYVHAWTQEQMVERLKLFRQVMPESVHRENA